MPTSRVCEADWLGLVLSAGPAGELLFPEPHTEHFLTWEPDLAGFNNVRLQVRDSGYRISVIYFNIKEAHNSIFYLKDILHHAVFP